MCANPECEAEPENGRTRCTSCRIYRQRRGYERPRYLCLKAQEPGAETADIGKHVPDLGDEVGCITIEHYRRMQVEEKPLPTCSVEWCQATPYLDGLCKAHSDLKAIRGKL